MLPTAVGIFAFVVVLAAFAVRYWLYGREISTYDFNEVFGFEPPSPEDGLEKIWAAQWHVDNMLQVLAEVYAKFDLVEREVAKDLKEAQSKLEARTYKTTLDHVRRLVKGAKAEFWHAHGLAKAFGFHVRKKYSDYLPPELRRKVLGPPQIGGRPGSPDPIPDTEAWWEREGVHGWR